jgi:hypothetical protein
MAEERKGKGIKKGKTNCVYFKWFISDLKDGTVRDPEILSNDEIQVFTKFPIACLDELGLFKKCFYKRY